MIINDLEELRNIKNGTNKNFKVIQHDEYGGKHDCTDHSVLFQDLSDKKYYSLWYTSSYNDGIQWYEDFPYSPPEVEISEVTTYTWKVKS